MQIKLWAQQGRALSALIALATVLGCGSSSDAEVVVEQDASTDLVALDSTGKGGAGGSAGSDAATGGTGGSAKGGSGGVEAGPEDCVNGLDDDLDSLVDCSDPDCNAGYQCEEAVPAGWEGYYRFLQNKYDSSLPLVTCPTGIQPARYFVEPDEQPLCAPCSCGQPSNFLCGAPPIECSVDKQDCSGAQAPAWNGPPQCTTIPTDFGSKHIISCRQVALPSVAKVGSCDPSTTTLLNPPLWGKMADSCSFPSGGGCASGSCVPKTAAPYEGPLCVRREGKHECPAGWSESLIIYSNGIDGRSCSACSCDPSAVECGGGNYTFYDADACGSCSGDGCHGPIQVGPGPECHDLTDLADGDDFSVQITSPAQPVTGCAVAGGVASGKVDALGEMTVCCRK